MENPEVSIIIYTYNRPQLTAGALRRLREQEDLPPFELIVSDSSFDDLTERVVLDATFSHPAYYMRIGGGEKGWQTPCRVINCAARMAHGETLLLLQPETFLHDAKALSKLISATHAVPGTVAVADTKRDCWDMENRGWIYFCAGAIKASAFRELGGFDEDYCQGIGMEDNDFSNRLYLAKLRRQLLDVGAVHMHHPQHYDGRGAAAKENEARIHGKDAAREQGRIGPIANQGRVWGSPSWIIKQRAS